MDFQTLSKSYFSRNRSVLRTLNDSSDTGLLGCGYVEKSREYGSHINLTRNNYDGVWVLSGTGTYEDSESGTREIRAGDFIQRLPGRRHSTVISSNDYRELYLVVGGDIYRLLESMDILIANTPVISPGLDFKMLEDFKALLENLSAMEPHQLPLLVPDAIALIIRAHYLHRTGSFTHDENRSLEAARQFMAVNLETRHSVEAVASYADMGYEKFRKLFAECYGVSPGRYMQQCRVNRAQQLLCKKDLSVKETASMLGYTDAYTFSKQFKQFTGLSPQHFREMFL